MLRKTSSKLSLKRKTKKDKENYDEARSIRLPPVYQATFSPIITRSNAISSNADADDEDKHKQKHKYNYKHKSHRVTHWLDSNNDLCPPKCPKQKDSYYRKDDAVSFLRRQVLLSEHDAVQLEIAATNLEIQNLTYSQAELKIQLQESPPLEADIVIQNREILTNHEKSERDRGLYFRFYFEDSKVTETFLSHCGNPDRVEDIEYVSLTRCLPSKSMISGTMQHTGIFIQKASGITHHSGPLPTNLLNRFSEIKSSSKRSKPPLREKFKEGTRTSSIVQDLNDIKYLSTGPGGTYYVEFHSGACWWSSNEDNEFQNCVTKISAKRVAFGGDRYTWIVVGHDGKCAWRGLPTQLHKKLQTRDQSMSAPCEVTLGPYGSWFIKYLDGATDYCLPANVAKQCEDVAKRGGRLTNVSLHADCDDYIIRYTGSKLKTAE